MLQCSAVQCANEDMWCDVEVVSYQSDASLRVLSSASLLKLSRAYNACMYVHVYVCVYMYVHMYVEIKSRNNIQSYKNKIYNAIIV